MKDWSKYLERPFREEVLPELLASGYCVVKEEYPISGFKHITIKKGDTTAVVVCCAYNMEDYENKAASETQYDLDEVD